MPYEKWFPNNLQNLSKLHTLSKPNAKSSESSKSSGLLDYIPLYSQKSNATSPSAQRTAPQNSQFSDLTPP